MGGLNSPDLDSIRVPPGQYQRSLYGGAMVTATPLVSFGGDIPCGPGLSQTIDIGFLSGARCTGFLITSVIGSVKISVNGGGLITVPTALAVSDAMINSLRIETGVGATCIVNLLGV